MLTTNVDVSDGLVNGARGAVVRVVTNSETHVLVKFDNSTVGHHILVLPIRQETRINLLLIPLIHYAVFL